MSPRFDDDVQVASEDLKNSLLNLNATEQTNAAAAVHPAIFKLSILVTTETREPSPRAWHTTGLMAMRVKFFLASKLWQVHLWDE